MKPTPTIEQILDIYRRIADATKDSSQFHDEWLKLTDKPYSKRPMQKIWKIEAAMKARKHDKSRAEQELITLNPYLP